ncbi:MAG TPA: NAD(P)-dependent oxidoreductase [Acidimicrobiales bacterium]|nr:NAD(P)-dependent oxidoreductase [Acidimicrobiales bacterium]
MPTSPSIGFIGLGSQGGPMARRIADAGFPLTLWARRPETLHQFADTPATTASSPAVLAQRSEIVGICVTGDDDVDQVVLGPDGVLAGLATGGTLVIHSTVHPQTCLRLSQAATEKGVQLIDAPVSGGGPAASQGSLLVMVGGDERVVERVRPVLATFGDPILHLGPVGAGQTAKLVNNLAFTAQIALALDIFAFVDRLGLDPAAMAEVLERGSGGSKAASVVSGSALGLSGLAQVAGPLLQKDFRLISDVARGQSVDLPDSILNLVEKSLEVFRQEGAS